MANYKDDLAWPLEAYTPLKTLIIGAGITGLSTAIALSLTGHTITIYEAAQSLSEVGAGLQIAPNASRVLARFGVLEQVMKKANVLEGLSLRRWKNDEEIGRAPLMPRVGEKYGAPLCVIHRADLQSILLQALDSLRNPVTLHLGNKVVALTHSSKTSIQLETGEWVEGDVIICADGVKSLMRQNFLSPGEENSEKIKKEGGSAAYPRGQADDVADQISPVPAGDAAYRVLIPRSKLEGNKQGIKLLDSNIGMRWMGPGGHIMAYPVRENTLYNIVLLHPQSSRSESESKPVYSTADTRTGKSSKNEMLSFYSSWNSTIISLLSYIPDGEVAEWNLLSLPTPYVDERELCAAQGIEDAGALACVLAKIGSKEEIGDALKVFESVRKERAERIQSSAGETRRVLHLDDGKEQRERDRKMRGVAGRSRGLKGEEKGEDVRNLDLWADEEWQEYMWGVDIMREAVEAWDRK
ncbi:salicylate hydroxylase [Hyaloscypha variabilis]